MLLAVPRRERVTPHDSRLSCRARRGRKGVRMSAVISRVGPGLRFVLCLIWGKSPITPAHQIALDLCGAGSRAPQG
jgi:hypothetical protein